ncbi:aspartate--tRNA ligase [Lentilactobacillus kribbianus]|uniref:aspartate--tRNA ligase n=1 Tax=Lentilactobacillus kribbianus TaxID=2729622 RepID=UPI0015549148|nr:aspartate--tRNA ligase [Lentilactobacillus kribbianus]
MQRTTYAGLVNEEYLNQTVTLFGWVDRRRDLGKLIFIDLRDREGIVQLAFNEDKDQAAFAVAKEVRNEYVVKVVGTVVNRAQGQENHDIKSGKVEVEVTSMEVLNASETLPFEVRDNTEVNEDLLLKYRYLELRRPSMQRNIKMRSTITRATREFFDNNGFLDIETPDLAKSTPEGARDYLVPSRVSKGHFYALPQSPQQYKQLLMGAGFDRYYQIARCFRDEDLRGDRQPEFTQIDVETSFMDQHDIMDFTEGMIQNVMKKTLGIDVTLPFPRITWQESMDRFGTDQPDARFGMEIQDVTELITENDIATPVFENTDHEVLARAIVAPGAADKYSRKAIDAKEQYLDRYGVQRLVWAKVGADKFSGGSGKMLNPIFAELTNRLGAKEGDVIFMVFDRFKVVSDVLGALRLNVAAELDLIPENVYKFLWVIDWPLFEYDEGDQRWVAAHHPFTAPNEGDEHFLDDGEDPHQAHAQSYDIILNGLELGGGSIRIHTAELQEKMFKALGFAKESAYAQFGYFLNALKLGFPPHGGIAIGLDRFARLLTGAGNIREVIAFPKNSKAIEPMTQAPSVVSDAQLEELGIKVDKKPEINE